MVVGDALGSDKPSYFLPTPQTVGELRFLPCVGPMIVIAARGASKVARWHGMISIFTEDPAEGLGYRPFAYRHYSSAR